MDLKDSIKQIALRWERSKDSLSTEEATKNALIMPMLVALGYDVFNPDEVMPEMTCDIGAKKGEKIDYAILRDGVPQILVECKQWEQDLSQHDNQLLRYFNVSEAKFGILTNGLEYRVYTDLGKPNVMDTIPFLSFDIRDIKESQIEGLKKFHKSVFDLDKILNSASAMKYESQLNEILKVEFNEPSAELTQYFGKQVYEGKYTTKVAEQMQPLVKQAIQNYINEQISSKLTAILKSSAAEEEKAVQAQAAEEEKKAEDIETNENEISGYNIVKAILCKDVDVDRVAMRDASNYCAILFDNNNRRPIVRFYFNNPKNLRISFFDGENGEEKVNIEAVKDIYNYEERLRGAVNKYLQA